MTCIDDDRVVVYLGGTMTETGPYTREWRKKVAAALSCGKYVCLDPYRRSEGKTIVNNGLGHLEGGTSFVHGDKLDVDRCDIMLVVLPYSTEDLGRQSIGTFWECGWANANNVPIVVVDLTADREYIAHPFFKTYAAAMCTDLAEAVAWIKGV